MQERRAHARLPLSRRVKVVCAETGRCYGGATRDVAAGGVCVRLDRPAAIAAGTRVRIAVDWTGSQGVVTADLMPEATVVRHLSLDGATFGLHYDRAQPLAATA